MNYPMIYLRVKQCDDIEEMRHISMTMVRCIPAISKGSGFVVCDFYEPEKTMYEGSREECLAFIEGYLACPKNDSHFYCPFELVVCLNNNSRMVVIPEDKFGMAMLPFDPKRDD